MGYVCIATMVFMIIVIYDDDDDDDDAANFATSLRRRTHVSSPLIEATPTCMPLSVCPHDSIFVQTTLCAHVIHTSRKTSFFSNVSVSLTRVFFFFCFSLFSLSNLSCLGFFFSLKR